LTDGASKAPPSASCQPLGASVDQESRHNPTETVDKMPTLRKIKRGVLPTHLPTQKHHI